MELQREKPLGGFWRLEPEAREYLKEHALSDAKTREFMATNYSTRKEVFNEINKLLARFDKLEEKLDRWMEKQ